MVINTDEFFGCIYDVSLGIMHRDEDVPMEYQ